MNFKPRNRTLRRQLALGSSVLLMSLSVPVQWAAAEETIESLDLGAQAWFWSTNQRFTVATKDPALGVQQTFELASGGAKGLVAVPGGIAPISPGHLGVSLVNGVSDMRAFLRWELGGVPEGAKVNSFPVSLSLSKFTPEHLQFHMEAGAKSPFTVNETFARVDACPVTETLVSSEAVPTSSFSFQRPELESGSTDINRKDQRLEPLYDCGLNRIRGQMSADRTQLEFDLKAIAQRWVDDPLSNNGIVLIGAAEGIATTWVLELHGAALTLPADVQGVPVSLPGDLTLPEAPEQPPNHYVAASEAAVAGISYEPPAVDDGGGNGGGREVIRETTVINQPGTSQTVVVNQPGTNTTETVYAYPGMTPTTPVGDVVTPAWMLLGLPIGLLGLGALFGAVGKDELTAGGAVIAGGRVASMLRARRLDA